MGGQGPRGRPGCRPSRPGTATTSTSSPTRPCWTPTSRRCRRSSPTSRRATSPGTTTCRRWVWTTFNEFQWDLNWANPSVLLEFAEIILGLANLGVEVLRLDAIAFLWKRLGTQLPEPARGARDHPGAARGHPDRRAGRGVQGGGDRRAARPGAVPRHGQPRRPGQRPRVPQQPDGPGLVDAGRPQHRARPAGPRARCRRRRPPARGSPTSAATTTSAGRSTTGTRTRSASPATDTAGSSPTGTPASSPAPGPTGWSSRPTRPPATAGSAAPRRPCSGSRPARSPARTSTTHWPGCSSRTRSSPAGAASRCLERRRARPGQRPRVGEPSPATRTTTGGHTARASTGPARSPATTCAPCPAGSFTGLKHLAAVRARLPQLHASARTPRSSRTPTTACSPSSAGTPAAPSSASTTSPSRRGPSSCTGSRTRARPCRTTRSAATSLAVGTMGMLWLPPYAAWWVVDAPAG